MNCRPTDKSPRPQSTDGISRRDLLLNGSSAVAAASIAWLAPASIRPAMAQLPSRQPHIVYIVADDLGWKDVGFHGSDIKTPNIDKLAQDGARLEQFYVQPMCTPTRAALMTGRYPCRYGLQTLVIPTPSKYGLPTDEWLLPQALREAGYRTLMVGKWHLGHADRKFWPRQRGFDYHYGSMVGEVDYYTHSSANVLDWYRNDRPVQEQGYVTQLWGADAVAQVNAHDPRTPLFLYLAFTAPHSPYQAPKEYVDGYQHIEDPTRRAYAAMITCMDDEIGKLISALEKKNMRDNTLIVFMSDNGGNQTALLAGDSDVSKLKLPADNGPYRGGKGTLYEGGTRVAALANWPGRIKPGEVKEMMHVVDMYPTLAGLAGAGFAKAKPLDGMDVWPAISMGGPSPRQEIVYNIEPFRGGVRIGDWKLIWRTPLPSALELYNIPQDPSEKANLADSNPSKVAELQKRIEQLARESAKPLFMIDAFAAVKGAAHGPPSLPDDEGYFTQGD
ncbi:arylsulfatase [Bradyrhizobium lablabi]|uniref:arylsulfatase B n=1 Tax=Bradyrhizobium lablabi TaxID=722472 RepID=UPI001BAB7681|nr:arylsulfatase [Bradyrhizobium lablabi]MBR0691891.1 arylsulfatase [Bradyrhizobium lablabi]